MVSVIIASFDRVQRLIECMGSVTRSEPLPAGGIQVIVVTSTYSTSELAEIEMAGATVVHLESRTFASAAHNAGVRVATGEYLLFLDDDNVVATDTVWRLSESLREWPDAVLVGPVMYYGAAPDRIWCAGVIRSRVLMRTRFVTKLPDPLPNRLNSEDFPNCFMVRRDAFNLVGGFDDARFPHHMAESDLARRLILATGNRVYCVPRARVWHFIGLSFARRLHATDLERAYMVGRDRAVFTALYANHIQWLGYVAIAQWVLAAVQLYALLFQSSGGRINLARAILRGQLRGLQLGLSARRKARLSNVC
jgi:GT2 family glycosyltransferase